MTNIGIFDSGLGGLAVLSKLLENHKANYFFLGDNKRVPYGVRDKEEIVEFSRQIVNFLEQFDIDYYIVACNTISVNAIDILREEFDKEFISITETAVEEGLKTSGDILVLATDATVNSHYYKEKIENNSNKKVREVKASKIVDYIESGITEGDELKKVIDQYLEKANEEKIENIILGCTHYPIVEDEIKKSLTYPAKIIDPALSLAKNLTLKKEGEGKLEIYMTDVNPITEKMASNILGTEVSLKEARLE